MKKRLLSLFLALTLACSLLVFPANAAETKSGICGDNVTWTLDENGVLTISGEGEMYAYTRDDDANPWTGEVIQTVIVEPGVTSIGDWAFFDCSWLKTVQISDSVTSIGKSAFYFCSNLEAITIPDSVTSLGRDAFCGCSSLASVTIPESITSLENSLFYQCRKLNDVTIPDSVTSIGSMAFYYCTGLESIVIPEQVTSIGNSAFKGCSSLTDVTIPESVASIGSEAFSNCSSLTEVAIPRNVETIKTGTFSNCSGLTSVEIPASVAKIELSAFSGCSGLQDVYYKGSREQWNAMEVLEGNDPLLDADIHYAVTTLDSGEYVDDVYGTHLYWLLTDDGTMTISGTGNIRPYFADEWSSWKSLVKSVEIWPGVTGIENDAFYYCGSLECVRIPDTVTSIGGSPFSGCSLRQISVSPGNESFQTVEGVLLTKDGTRLIRCPAAKTGEYWIPAGVTRIDAYAFYNCKNLTGVTIPYGVTDIGGAAFYGCSGLTKMTIPNGVTGIEISAFAGCSSLTSVTIPASVTSIGSGAFFDCSSLTGVTIPNSVTSIGGNAFSGCSSLTGVTIPASVTSIGSGAFSGCSSLTEIRVADENPKYQSDQGALLNKGGTQLIRCPGGKTGSFTIPKGVAVIADNAFSGCFRIDTVTIPKSVIGIGSYAFSNCSSLTDVYYDGNADQWAAISIGSDNDYLTNATIHFGASTPGRIESNPADVTVLAGERVTFSVTVSGDVVSYQWQVKTPGGEWANCDGNAATLELTAYDSMNGNQYRCVITDQDGNSVSSDSAVLTVAKPVTITGSPIDSVGKLGGVAAFAVEAEGEGLCYQWQFSDNGGESWSNSSVTAQVYTTKLTAARDGRMVRCVVSDRFGYSAISGTAKMCTEQQTLLITAHPVNVEGKANATVSFRVTAVGEGLSYQWQISDDGETWKNSSVKSAVYSTKLTSGRDGRLVRCIVTDQYGNTAISETAVMRLKNPLVITKLPENYVGKVNSTASFTVTAQGSGLSYQWQYSDNGTKWSNSSVKAAVYSTKLTAARDGRMVRCVITDRNGNSVTSASASMKIG